MAKRDSLDLTFLIKKSLPLGGGSSKSMPKHFGYTLEECNKKYNISSDTFFRDHFYIDYCSSSSSFYGVPGPRTYISTFENENNFKRVHPQSRNVHIDQPFLSLKDIVGGIINLADMTQSSFYAYDKAIDKPNFLIGGDVKKYKYGVVSKSADKDIFRIAENFVISESFGEDVCICFDGDEEGKLGMLSIDFENDWFGCMIWSDFLIMRRKYV